MTKIEEAATLAAMAGPFTLLSAFEIQIPHLAVAGIGFELALRLWRADPETFTRMARPYLEIADMVPPGPPPSLPEALEIMAASADRLEKLRAEVTH